MDLAKILAELRLELQCLDTAIESVEKLARVQNIADVDAIPETAVEAQPGPPEPAPEGAVPVKRRRGRPRKEEASGLGSTRSSGGSTTSPS